LTAVTIIPSLEHEEEYCALHASLVHDYEPRDVVEQQLVERLASLFWRLRRTTLIETGLFEIEAANLTRRNAAIELAHGSLAPLYHMLQDASLPLCEGTRADQSNDTAAKCNAAVIYRRLCRIQPMVLKRLNRYETALWRQLGQVLLMLAESQCGTSRIVRLVKSADNVHR
jgi:hypothetical protein